MYCNFTLTLLSYNLHMLQLKAFIRGVTIELAHHMYIQMQCNRSVHHFVSVKGTMFTSMIETEMTKV